MILGDSISRFFLPVRWAFRVLTDFEGEKYEGLSAPLY